MPTILNKKKFNLHIGTNFSTAIKILSIIFAMFGKFGSAICTSSIYTITVELYPTVLRFVLLSRSVNKNRNLSS